MILVGINTAHIQPSVEIFHERVWKIGCSVEIELFMRTFYIKEAAGIKILTLKTHVIVLIKFNCLNSL
jgi:hypothetical protein